MLSRPTSGMCYSYLTHLKKGLGWTSPLVGLTMDLFDLTQPNPHATLLWVSYLKWGPLHDYDWRIWELMQVPGSTFLLRDPPSMKKSDQSVKPSMLALLKCLAIGTWKSLTSRIVFTYYQLRLVIVWVEPKFWSGLRLTLLYKSF